MAGFAAGRIVRVRVGMQGNFPNSANTLLRAELQGPSGVGGLYQASIQGSLPALSTGFGTTCTLPTLNSFSEPGATTFDIEPLGFPQLSDGSSPFSLTYRTLTLSQTGAPIFRGATLINGAWTLRLFLDGSQPAGVFLDCWTIEIHWAPPI